MGRNLQSEARKKTYRTGLRVENKEKCVKKYVV